MSTTLIELSVPWKELKKSEWETGAFIISKIVDAGLFFFFQVKESCIPRRNIKVLVDLFEKEY